MHMSLETGMFRDDPASYKGNVFLESITEPQGLAQIFSEGTFKELDAIFFEGWSDKVAAMLNISKGLFLSCYMADLKAAIEKVKNFKCFNNLICKLAKVDDTFIATVFEVEMAEIIVEILKGKISDIEFAGCFTTKGAKKIDLRVKVEDHWVYFESTKVIDYKEKSNVMRLLNLLWALVAGTEIVIGKNIEVTLEFSSLPNQELIDFYIKEISGHLNHKLYNFTITRNVSSLSIRETKEKGVANLKIKSQTLSNKLKDKYFKEIEHFEKDDFNVIVIDVTYLPDNPEDLIGLTKTIFEMEGNLTAVSSVILVSKKYTIDMRDSFPLGARWEAPIVFNGKSDKSDFMRRIFGFPKLHE